MLYTSTISQSALELLNKFMTDKVMDDFILVGGTALALQLGHRISIDLDLFSNEKFDENLLAEYLRLNYKFELDFISKNTIKREINGIKIDCIAHQYKWINRQNVEENIRLAGFNDIAAMKLNAIAGKGTRIKDYIDIAFLSAKMSFNKMLKAYEIKYKSNPVIPVKAILYFDDINFNEPVKMIDNKSFNWNKIEKRLRNMVDKPNKLFAKI